MLTDCVISPEARTIVRTLNSYTEVSPSGTGLLILVEAMLPGPGIPRMLGPGQQIEIKAEGYFHTFTGKHLEDTPLTIEPRQAEIDALYSMFAGSMRQRDDSNRPKVPGSIERQIHLLEKWADEYGFPSIQFVKEPDGKGAVTVVLEHCPRDESHGGTSAGMIFFPDGGRASCCHHTSCRALIFKAWWAEVEMRLGRKLNFARELIRR